MKAWTNSIVIGAAAAASLLIVPSPARAGVGDLLVAPTRLVLDGRKGAEVILNNIGDEPATYRVSIEFRRMTEAGDLVDVTAPSDADKKAEDMILYAPRKVVLAPREPQAIRIRAAAPEGLPDGEYRVHLLFRAIPPATPIADANAEKPKGVQFKLTPVYGVTIPVIVRLGNLQVTAGIADVHLEQKRGAPAVGLDLVRQGSRSTYGEVRVLKAGVKEPIADMKGVAVYTEVGKRHVILPMDDADLQKKALAELVATAEQMGVAGASKMSKQELVDAILKVRATGPVSVEYLETYEDGASHLLAQTQAVLR